MRRWVPDDREPFARLNSDPEVMRHLPAALTRAESDALIERIELGFETYGHGLWAVELTDNGQFIGFVGLQQVAAVFPFAPSVEVGWRLSRRAWGFGYATEAARQAVAVAFDVASLEELVSFTVAANAASQAVMRRIGMTHDQTDDFDHPELAADDRRRAHVLYRLTARQWRATRTANA